MEPFFTADHRFPTISIALEDILPTGTTSTLLQERAVYQYYVNAIAALPADEALRPFRHKALMGSLTPLDSVKRFFRNRTIKHLAQSVFVLEATAAHGWTKPYYMWADCESPENFDNVLENGLWTSQTVWSEPAMALEAHSSDHAWCSLQIRT